MTSRESLKKIAVVSPPGENHITMRRILNCSYIDTFDAALADQSAFDAVFSRRNDRLTIAIRGIPPFFIQAGTAWMQICIMYDIIHSLSGERDARTGTGNAFNILDCSGELQYVMNPASPAQFQKLKPILAEARKAVILLFLPREKKITAPVEEDLWALLTDLTRPASHGPARISLETILIDDPQMFRSSLTKLLPSYSVFYST